MLESYRKGYAVMTEDLSGISFDSAYLDECKEFLKKGYVIAERIPKVCGFSVTIRFHKYWMIFHKSPRTFNIFWLHVCFGREFIHKTGKILARYSGK